MQEPQSPRCFHYVERRKGIYYTVEELDSHSEDISALLAESHKIVIAKVRTPTHEVTANVYVPKIKDDDWDYVELDEGGEPISVDGNVTAL
ncbi:hypothetical protein A2926_00415 [Candidatus Giovannonibacteria bacterium RIFCSPLOWO2_01_FULL_44_40]|uniref:Uncharacterized protein n=1 Tax=Candidatus Giovannonibacteria bacterium RIFCSPHIGHO2_01_FULL_45_23 TaxID=1798325 RepID=A0A1F5VEU4_9BACT|nr:MAG: hypothetical protein A2834_00430 [Candidatus Giovannonibacteria bacterium RIFCSPHIGHO2_01_FULL_45_23]OGF76513.1 MAG: hypothetical protein A3C77_03135 [Candidatus Giovannonibacteria bacterium RIFCSPHIGHO2_02_FULL_45_13]OGF79779.1 MAG: hypothetical protein A2926_00415 [Candidatus Giovannonibacteria bacterium RIFCSPLOWO2_01_FULL_44_40]